MGYILAAGQEAATAAPWACEVLDTEPAITVPAPAGKSAARSRARPCSPPASGRTPGTARLAPAILAKTFAGAALAGKTKRVTQYGTLPR